MPSADRYSRQAALVPRERLEAMEAAVVGVGAVGRQAALQLAAMGAPSLRLVDFDTVEESNVASQGYWESDIGRPKVEATASACRLANPEMDVAEVNGRFRRSMEIGQAVFCCVDSIAVRRLVWESVKHRAAFFCDARMSAEALRVLAVAGDAGRSHYPTTLFRAEEAHRGACAARSAIYAASIAAGLMLAQFARWLRGLPTDADLQFNILTSELDCAE